MSVFGILNTLAAIASALGVSAIKKVLKNFWLTFDDILFFHNVLKVKYKKISFFFQEKIVLMRRLSIAFWVLTALMLILNIIILAFDFNSKDEYISECVREFANHTKDECEHTVRASLIGETIRLIALGSVSVIYVVKFDV